MDSLPSTSNDPLIKLAFCHCGSGFCQFNNFSTPGRSAFFRGYNNRFPLNWKLRLIILSHSCFWENRGKGGAWL